jgi:hypothetical protein
VNKKEAKKTLLIKALTAFWALKGVDASFRWHDEVFG